MDRPRYARRVARQTDSSLKEVLESFPGVISFAGGLPDEQVFPVEQIAAVVDEIAHAPVAWQYLPTEGHPALREAIAGYMAELGVEAGVDNVLITQGSQQALDLVAKALVDPGDRVLIEPRGTGRSGRPRMSRALRRARGRRHRPRPPGGRPESEVPLHRLRSTTAGCSSPGTTARGSWRSRRQGDLRGRGRRTGSSATTASRSRPSRASTRRAG